MLRDTRERGGLNAPSGVGKISIVHHVGSEDGFVSGCGKCYVEKKDSSDHHQKIEHIHFERLRNDEFLPNLQDKYVALIGNSEYHSQQTAESKCLITA